MTDEALDRVKRTYRRVGTRWGWLALSLAGFQGFEPSLRRRTVEHLQLSPGDAVLDVACGRGSNFPFLQRTVGDAGRIVGVDYFETMLAGAEALVRKQGWTNVELVRGDAAKTQYQAEYDGALCTIAMTVIPGWHEALTAMTRAVREGKRIAVMDGRRPTGLMRLGEPYARLFALAAAADLNRDVLGQCRALLHDVREDSRMFGAYFIISGTPRRNV